MLIYYLHKLGTRCDGHVVFHKPTVFRSRLIFDIAICRPMVIHSSVTMQNRGNLAAFPLPGIAPAYFFPTSLIKRNFI